MKLKLIGEIELISSKVIINIVPAVVHVVIEVFVFATPIVVTISKVVNVSISEMDFVSMVRMMLVTEVPAHVVVKDLLLSMEMFVSSKVLETLGLVADDDVDVLVF